jgi:hypothetical protein
MSAGLDVRPAADSDRGRRVLKWLLLLSLGAFVLLLALSLSLSPPGMRRVERLQLAGSAAGFVCELGAWEAPVRPCAGPGVAASVAVAASAPAATAAERAAPPAAAPDILRLRTHLLVDSVAFVPGYVGLLAFFVLQLGRSAGVRRAGLRHLLCVPAVLAGLWDIAENGLTARAADDYFSAVLADATVQDLTRASLDKWRLIGLAALVLAGVAWRAGFHAPRAAQLRWGAVWASLSAGLLGWGAQSAWAQAELLGAGMLSLTAALGLLSLWRWQHRPD